MKPLLLLLPPLLTLLVLQGVSTAPKESEVYDVLHHLSQKQLDTLADTLVKGGDSKRELHQRAVRKKELLDDATKMTEALIAQESVAAETGTVNEATKKLLQFLSTNPRIKRAGLAASTQLEAIKNYRNKWLQKRGHLDEEADFWTDMKRDIGSSFLKENPEVVSPDTRQTVFDPDTCPFPKVACDRKVKYRTIDGTCNNQGADKEAWGSSHRAQARLLEPVYGDGVNSPRIAADGGALSSARLVSRTLFDMDQKPSGLYTVLNMVFGQLLDHDISQSPASALSTNLDTLENATINCGPRGCDTYDGTDLSKKDCFPITFPPNDMYAEGRECMNFVRSQAYLNSNCDLKPRQQANSITSWLDVSMVYGSTRKRHSQLVDTATGEMVMMPHPIVSSQKPLLPPSTRDKCSGLTDVIHCFLAGDVRQNEQVALTAMHTVFARMHNHILEQLNSAYASAGVTAPDTDTLFQECRKILGGVWQHMVYDEYLRALLGPKIMEKYQLEPLKQGFFTDYSEDVRADVANVFAAAAFRFGHSEIPDMMRFASKLFDVFEETHLSEIFFSPTTLYHSPVPEMSGVDAIILGMISSSAESPDDQFCGQIANHLFTKQPPFGIGLDLIALNIQRGRDHGIPGYAAWSNFCNNDNPQSFNDFKNIPVGSQQKLKDVYSDVVDVDLFAGAMLEKQAEGAQIGPTFGCIIAKQFHNLKFGDRFYYENDEETGFTEEQLTEIRQFTLARLLCDTLDDVHSIQKFVLVQPLDQMNMKRKIEVDYILQGDDNKRRPCSMIPDMDYSVFVRSGP